MTDFLQPMQNYYTHAFPKRQDARLHDLALLSRGWESDIYAFRVEWDENGHPRQEDLVLRVYPGGDAYTKSGGEYNALTFLHRLGYPVPRVDRLERDASPFGMPFLIMERIHGKPLWGIMFHSLLWRRRRLISQFCGLLARLHAIDWHSAVENPREYEPDGNQSGGDNTIVGRMLDSWQEFVNGQDKILPGFAPVLEWLVNHQRDVVSTRASLVHMDFHPNNLLLCGDGSAVVIDWTNFNITDYRFDLAWTLVLVCSVEGLRWRKPFLREYERQRGQPVEGLEFFEAAACLRRLYSVLFSLAAGAGQLGMRPGVEEEMRRDAPRVRLVYNMLQQRTGLAIPEVEEFLNG